MVTNINVGLDDDEAERAQAVKEEIGGTWPEAFMEMVELSERLLEAREEDYKPVSVVLEEHLEPAAQGDSIESREAPPEPSGTEPDRTPTGGARPAAGGEQPPAHTGESRGKIKAQSKREEAEGILLATLPGQSDTKVAARMEAVLSMYDLLCENPGKAFEKHDLLDAVDASPEDLHYGSMESFWGNAVKKNKSQGRPNTLGALPAVEIKGDLYVYGRSDTYDPTKEFDA